MSKPNHDIVAPLARPSVSRRSPPRPERLQPHPARHLLRCRQHQGRHLQAHRHCARLFHDRGGFDLGLWRQYRHLQRATAEIIRRLETRRRAAAVEYADATIRTGYGFLKPKETFGTLARGDAYVPEGFEKKGRVIIDLATRTVLP